MSSSFGIRLLVFVFFIFLILFGAAALTAFILKKLGADAGATWERGLKRALFMTLIIGAMTGGIALIQIFGFGQSLEVGLSLSFWLIWITVLFWTYFTLFSSRLAAGQELLDIGPFPVWWAALIAGAASIWLAFMGNDVFLLMETKFSGNLFRIFYLGAGSLFFIAGFSRLKVCENGFRADVALIKWRQIESFEWTGGKGRSYTLNLRCKGKLPVMMRIAAFSVSADKKEKMDFLLKQHLPETASG